jgi:hypothetical protein
MVSLHPALRIMDAGSHQIRIDQATHGHQIVTVTAVSSQVAGNQSTLTGKFFIDVTFDGIKGSSDHGEHFIVAGVFVGMEDAALGEPAAGLGVGGHGAFAIGKIKAAELPDTTDQEKRLFPVLAGQFVIELIFFDIGLDDLIGLVAVVFHR